MSPHDRDLRNDANHAAAQAKSAMIDTAADLANKASTTIDRAVTAAGDVASDAAQKGRVAGQQIEAVAGNMKSAVDKSLRDQPMATLAVAAAVGFIVGAIWKS